MDLFLDDHGEPVKFFLQPDLGPEDLNDLNHDITEHKGRVIDKVPLQGFVLIDAATEYGQRLVTRWRTPDKPQRRVVPASFVQACINARGIIPPIFTAKNGEPLRMHIHHSIQDALVRNRAHDRIWHSGGDPTVSAQDADVVVVGEDEATIARVRKEYAGRRPPVRVEAVSWIKRCVNAGECIYSPLTSRRARNVRAEFSAQDDVNLAAYIADNHPDKTVPGRKGNLLYQNLCTNLTTYPWAKRHPWASWRERYNKDTDRFDSMVDQHVAKRNLPVAKKLARARKGEKQTQSLAEQESELESQSGEPAADVKREPASEAHLDAEPTPEQNGKAEASRSKERQSSKGGTPPHSVRKRSRSRDSWGSQWAIREAETNEAERPEWARRGRKRGSQSASNDGSPAKKPRRDAENPPSSSIGAKQAAHATSDPARMSGNEPLKDPAESVTDDSEIEVDRMDVAAPDVEPESFDMDAFENEVLSYDEPAGSLGPETQLLLAEHNAVKHKPARRSPSPQPVGDPEQVIHEKLSAIAHKHRFYLEDVHIFYQRTQNLAATERVFRHMRKAADSVMQAATEDDDEA